MTSWGDLPSRDQLDLERSNAQLQADIMRIRAATVFVAAFGVLFVLWWFSQ